MTRFRFFAALPAVLLIAGTAAAQNTPRAPRIGGTVASIAQNHTCFEVADPSGNRATVLINKDTTYSLGRTPSDFADVLCLGDDVVATLAPNGIATDVSNRNRSRRDAAQLRPVLECTDDEWTVLGPLLMKVLDADRAVTGRGQSDFRVAVQDLRSVLTDPNAGNWDIMSKLKAVRSAREKALADLAKARSNLVALLTERQEAKLAELGILN